jgi:Na+:H+ antiporter, NhaA family
VLFLFALINAGIVVQEFEPGTWAVPVATVVGRALGVWTAVALVVALGMRLPLRFGWRDLVVVTFITSTGFTFSLFVATAVFPVGSLLTQTRMGALTTVFAALLAMTAAFILRTGRFSPAVPE